MLPDFAAPAFSFVALCTLRLVERADGTPRQVRSDYRCHLRYADAAVSEHSVDARVYFVGQDAASSGDEAPAVVAFVDWETQLARCRVGEHFELVEGQAIVAVGTVRALAKRS